MKAVFVRLDKKRSRPLNQLLHTALTAFAQELAVRYLRLKVAAVAIVAASTINVRVVGVSINRVRVVSVIIVAHDVSPENDYITKEAFI